MSSIKVGFVGVGNLGMTMAKKLVENGMPLTVYDMRKEAVQEMVALGAKGASSCCEVAELDRIVVTTDHERQHRKLFPRGETPGLRAHWGVDNTNLPLF